MNYITIKKLSDPIDNSFQLNKDLYEDIALMLEYNWESI